VIIKRDVVLSYAGLLGIVAVLFGCGEPGVPGHWIKGQVTLDGQPLPEAHILFVQEGAGTGGDTARVLNGRYAIRLSPGVKLVSITAERVVPSKQDKLGMALIEQYIPEQYNRSSTLTVTVDRDMVQDFALKSE
jgi:hypothetical protein